MREKQRERGKTEMHKIEKPQNKAYEMIENLGLWGQGESTMYPKWGIRRGIFPSIPREAQLYQGQKCRA